MCQIYLNNIDVFEYVSKDSNLGGNAEENTAFRPMCFGTGAEGFCVIKKKKELRKNDRFKIFKRKSGNRKTEH